MKSLSKLALAPVLLALVVQAGCESVDAKVDRLYAEATELSETGDAERATVLLRSLFRLDGTHRDARTLYAEIMRESGDLEEAFRHYLLIVEQYPEDPVPRRALTDLAIEIGAWEEAERHLARARELDPDAPELVPLGIAVDFATAMSDRDQQEMTRAGEAARAYLETHPENLNAHRVVISDLARQERFAELLTAVDAALALYPDQPDFNQAKLSALSRLQDEAGLGEHLKVMVDRFPDNPAVPTALVRWYASTGDLDGAEAFLRAQADEAAAGDDPDSAEQANLRLVQFLREARGQAAALAELDRLTGLPDAPTRYSVLRASLLFDMGEAQGAIEALDRLAAETEPSDARRELLTAQARMLLATGEETRAREIIAEVLAADPRNPDALKLDAARLIEEDQVREAVLALRTAIDEAPEDVDAVTLLARAYERGGNRELMAESLARAYEMSGYAEAEALRYAAHLVTTDNLLPAEDVLLRAARRDPGNVALLGRLAEVYLALEDVERARQVVAQLKALGTPEAATTATAVEATMLQRMARTEESIALLQDLAESGNDALAAKAAIIRARIANGEIEQARAYLDGVLADTPADSPARTGIDFLDAALTATEGDLATARQIYRDILADDPTVEAAWRALVALELRAGDRAAAEAALADGRAALPQSADLSWIAAGLAEQRGDYEEAIGLYEDLYRTNSNSALIANNLASLLTTRRDDAESLERAFRIARRLRGSSEPAFQDTYGWIAYRLGNHEEALSYLEPAAASLPQDPNVQYHLARTYHALGRHEDAEAAYQRALSLWEAAPTPRAEAARADLARLRAERSDPAAAE